MTLQDFIAKWIGKKADFDGFYEGQCVDLFRFYCQEVLNIPQAYPVISDTTKGRGACDFWLGFDSSSQLKDNFTQIKNSADFKPVEGDVMIWNRKAGGGHGHIAICTGKNTDLNKFESFDQNWSKVSFCEVVSHPYTNVYGVLRPNKKTETTITIPTSERDNLIERSTRLDAFEKAGYPDAQSVTLSMETLEDRINTMKDEERSFIIKLIELVNPSYPIPPTPDRDLTINLVKQLVNEQSTLQTAKAKLEKESAQREKELEEQIYQQEVRLKRFEQDLERLQSGYEKLKVENDKLKSQKIENSWFSDLVKKLFERTK